MIDIYTREDCGSCVRVKTELKARNIPYKEFFVDKDVTKEWINETFPGARMLPILVTDTEVFSGPTEILPMLESYRQDVGKQLLNEDYSADGIGDL